MNIDRAARAAASADIKAAKYLCRHHFERTARDIMALQPYLSEEKDSFTQQKELFDVMKKHAVTVNDLAKAGPYHEHHLSDTLRKELLTRETCDNSPPLTVGTIDRFLLVPEEIQEELGGESQKACILAHEKYEQEEEEEKDKREDAAKKKPNTQPPELKGEVAPPVPTMKRKKGDEQGNVSSHKVPRTSLSSPAVLQRKGRDHREKTVPTKTAESIVGKSASAITDIQSSLLEQHKPHEANFEVLKSSTVRYEAKRKKWKNEGHREGRKNGYQNGYKKGYEKRSNEASQLEKESQRKMEQVRLDSQKVAEQEKSLLEMKASKAMTNVKIQLNEEFQAERVELARQLAEKANLASQLEAEKANLASQLAAEKVNWASQLAAEKANWASQLAAMVEMKDLARHLVLEKANWASELEMEKYLSHTYCRIAKEHKEEHDSLQITYNTLLDDHKKLSSDFNEARACRTSLYEHLLSDPCHESKAHVRSGVELPLSDDE